MTDKEKVVFQDDSAEENVPSNNEAAMQRKLDGEVEFDRKIDPGTTRPLVEEGFVGVDPEYRNYASVAGQPFFAEEGVQKELEEYAFGEELKASEESDEESEEVEEVESEEVEEVESEEGVEPEPDGNEDDIFGTGDPLSAEPAPSAGDQGKQSS